MVTSNWTFAKMLKQARTTTYTGSETALGASSITLRRKGLATVQQRHRSMPRSARTFKNGLICRTIYEFAQLIPMVVGVERLDIVLTTATRTAVTVSRSPRSLSVQKPILQKSSD